MMPARMEGPAIIYFPPAMSQKPVSILVAWMKIFTNSSMRFGD